MNLGCGRDVRPGWINVDRHPFVLSRGLQAVFTREDRGLQSATMFAIRSLRVYRGPPCEWHVRRHLPRLYRWLWGDGRAFTWTVGAKREIHVVLEKRVHQI